MLPLASHGCILDDTMAVKCDSIESLVGFSSPGPCTNSRPTLYLLGCPSVSFVVFVLSLLSLLISDYNLCHYLSLCVSVCLWLSLFVCFVQCLSLSLVILVGRQLSRFVLA